MMELLKELEGKRDNQLRAKVEKETIQKELEVILIYCCKFNVLAN
jgi:hypothetical protein